MEMINIVIAGLIIAGIIWLFVWLDQRSKRKEAEAKQARYDELVRIAKEKYERLSLKHGKEIALKLVNAEYFIGMTREQLLDSKGREPDSAEVQQLKTKSKETLVWGNKNSGDWFVLEEGLVVKITDRPDHNTPVKLRIEMISN